MRRWLLAAFIGTALAGGLIALIAPASAGHVVALSQARPMEGTGPIQPW